MLFGLLVGLFFFFQAEDGIRDYKVTGVQTCALPISFERLTLSSEDLERGRHYAAERRRSELRQATTSLEDFYRSLEMEVEFSSVEKSTRSEERRVGKECRSWWMRCQ